MSEHISTDETVDIEVVSRAGQPVEPDQAVVTESDKESETISSPGKVMRIGSMIKQLLEEVRQAPLDEESRVRLRTIYERSVKELAGSLSPDLQTELNALALPFGSDEVPSEAELRIAQAQLVGWLEGLFHGIQATLFAQQMAAQAQLQQMRQLPPGAVEQQGQPPHNGGGGGGPALGGTYL
jgi:hypothetical protein